MEDFQNRPGAIVFNRIRKIIHDATGKDINSLERDPDKQLFQLIYHAKINDILNDKSLEKAYPVAIQFVEKDANQRNIAYEIRLDNETLEHVFNGKSDGPFIEELKQISEALKEHKELEELEHAYLRLMSLRIKAIWFRGTTRDKDYYVPLSPAFYNLQVGKLYTSAEFIPILIQAANQITQAISLSSSDDLLGG